jgi:tungstate transport system permease protein
MTTFTDTALTALHLLTELDPLLWSIVGRSLWVSVLATAVACSLGVVLGAWLGVARFAGEGPVCRV